MYENIDELLQIACEKNASDLHLAVDSPPVLRIDGQLVVEGHERLTSRTTEKIAKEVIPTEDWNYFLETGEIDLAYELNDGTRFRVNAFLQKAQVSLVMRVIENDVPSLTDLNMPVILQDMADKPQGLFLVTGPTGSGKSTTLAAMIDYINRNHAKHIITLEDPIEYEHDHRKSIINQREVGRDTKNFSNALRSALRQDPDVILVGELRDFETISTAITAAETGHLVFATLHTSSAIQTLTRIVDVFPPHQQEQVRTQLSMVLTGVISQRLIPRADKKGRVAATEVLINLPAVSNLIRNGKIEQIHNVLQTSRASGMHSLDMAINRLLMQRQISYESAQQHLTNAGDY